MKTTIVAALAAAQLPLAAQAAELPREVPARHAAAEASLQAAAGKAEALRAAARSQPGEGAAGREERPRKRKSTGDKILTGAAVVLGVGALAVTGLLVAIFVN